MLSFRQFVEKKDNCKGKLRLANDADGEPEVVAGKPPKKGKLKYTFNDEGELTTER